MSLSSNTAQTRELSELRNHLKWLDEERRKSGRKMTELEQRLAQQGRELAERDQKIQELEWHVANFSERFERMPDLDTNAAGIEQRLQDLEWHLSNMNTQLTRVPNMDEERARLLEEVARAVSQSQEQVEASQSILESRLRTEIVAQREVEERLVSAMRQEEHNLIARQEEQARAINEMDQQFSALQESVGILTGQLRERTVNLAAESQANISSLAARLQEHLDAMAVEQQARMDAFTFENNRKLGDISAEIEGRQELLTVDWQSRIQLLTADLQTQHEQFAGYWQSRFDTLSVPTVDVSPELMRLDEQLRELTQSQTQWETRWTQLEKQIGEASEKQIALVREETIAAAREAADSRAVELAQQIAHMEENLTKLGHVREIMPLLDRLEQELELRQAEEVRLANLIGTQENRFAPLAAALEEVTQSTSALLGRTSDSERLLEEVRASVQDINDNWKPAMSEANRRLTPLAEKVTVLSNTIMRAEAGLQAVTGDQSEMREMIVTLTDDMRRSQSDVVRQLEGWQVTLDENKDTIERFTQQWITLSNQYKEARMAVQNFAHWQKQLEQQKREASEMLRVESNRMQSRWDGFLMEIQEKLKNFELDLSQKWQSFELENEQKWSGARRSEQLWREELGAVDELIQKLQQDNRNLIWRVQTAQADAIKKWPRLLMEEVEKAVELNPNRRLSSAATPPRADMSVVDAIEQGLITIDYSDDAPLDL